MGRIGHGVGYETTEYPSLAKEEDIVFKPGMTFACNPNFVQKPYGMFNSDDNWAITDGQPKLLSVLTVWPALYLKGLSTFLFLAGI